MCLIIFRWNPDSNEPLILLGNRDEFYARPTLPAHHWDDPSGFVAGKDQKAGGTWLGLSYGGRLCTVTNYREVPAVEGMRSRGEIPLRFHEGSMSALDYGQALTHEADKFSGYNALIYDGEKLVYVSNRATPSFKALAAGDYALSNQVLDSPWPKSLRAKHLFQSILDTNPDVTGSEGLLDIMRDNHRPADHDLPDTGIGLNGERLLSPIFIESEHYGTRATSLVRVSKSNTTFIERNYLIESVTENTTENKSSDRTNAETGMEFEDREFLIAH